MIYQCCFQLITHNEDRFILSYYKILTIYLFYNFFTCLRARSVLPLWLWTPKIDTATQPFLGLSDMRHGTLSKLTGQYGTFLNSAGRHEAFLNSTGRHYHFL